MHTPTELDTLRAQLARLEDLNRRLAAAEEANTAQRTLITRILEAVPGGIVHVGAKSAGRWALGHLHGHPGPHGWRRRRGVHLR